MLYWTLVFLVIALIAEVLGFTGVAIAAAGAGKLLFVVFLILFVISLVTHLGRRRARRKLAEPFDIEHCWSIREPRLRVGGLVPNLCNLLPQLSL